MNKLEQIRAHLVATATRRRSRNTFQFGKIEIKIDGSLDGDLIRISIYDPEADRDVIIPAALDAVEILENAMGNEKPPEGPKVKSIQLCPKCNGEGRLPTTGLSTSTALFETCGVCKGAKFFIL